MEILNIDSRTWNMMLDRFEEVARRMEVAFGKTTDKQMERWIDGQQVCQILNISKRTLQTLRDNGTLPYSQINGKMFYRTEDIEAYINKCKR